MSKFVITIFRILLVACFVLAIVIVCRFTIRNHTRSENLDAIFGPDNYEVLDSEVGAEGIFGDLNRSWIVKIGKNDSVWIERVAAWKEARPLYSEEDLRNMIRSSYSHFVPSQGAPGSYIQVFVPGDVFRSERRFTARFVLVEPSEKINEQPRRDACFVLLESN